MTEYQRITLRDVLRDKGLSDRRIDDVMLLLRYKPHCTQMAFYYVAQGMTQSNAAVMVGVSQQNISRCIHVGCADLLDYLRLPES